MLDITDLKKGTVFVLSDEPFKVVDYHQKVMGRGGSIVNVRIKSLISGRVVDKTFKGNEQLLGAEIISVKVQYLYADGSSYYFMDLLSYEQYVVPREIIAEGAGYIREGDNAQLQFFRGQPISLDLPKNVNLKVEYTETAVKGDTSTAITKDAKLETGITIRVPAFIKSGDLVSVDTANGTYRERVK